MTRACARWRASSRASSTRRQAELDEIKKVGLGAERGGEQSELAQNRLRPDQRLLDAAPGLRALRAGDRSWWLASHAGCLSRGCAQQRSKRFEPQLQEIFQMFFRLSLCFTTAVVGQEIAMRQARLPRPQVSIERHTANHDTADECRTGMRAVLKPGDMRRGHYCPPLSDQRKNPHHWCPNRACSGRRSSPTRCAASPVSIVPPKRHEHRAA
jgi:hypothetical protein